MLDPTPFILVHLVCLDITQMCYYVWGEQTQIKILLLQTVY